MKKIIRTKFDLFSEWVGDKLGKPVAFTLALSLIILWAVAGPFCNFSESWQLVVNTGTTIATFLMVFLLQNTQNRDTEELHDKLEAIRRQQDLMLDLERKLAERVMEIQYQQKRQLDK